MVAVERGASSMAVRESAISMCVPALRYPVQIINDGRRVIQGITPKSLLVDRKATE